MWPNVFCISERLLLVLTLFSAICFIKLSILFWKVKKILFIEFWSRTEFWFVVSSINDRLLLALWSSIFSSTLFKSIEIFVVSQSSKKLSILLHISDRLLLIAVWPEVLAILVTSALLLELLGLVVVKIAFDTKLSTSKATNRNIIFSNKNIIAANDFFPIVYCTGCWGHLLVALTIAFGSWQSMY